MEKKESEKRKLLDRWRRIQEDLEDDDPSPLKFQRTCRAKEQWFSDSFQFLIDLPTDDHIWCGFPDIMGPLLETFHSYFNDNRSDSPLKLLWKRISGEMGQCAQCICQHHQAQESYSTEYESDTIDPLLKVLHDLDEERVTQHLKEMNARLRRQEYNPECHGGEVVTVMFEVLMYPTMLDDQLLVNEFQFFIEEIEKSHDVNLAGSQQYPGVYALLFLKSGKARAIGLRLAGHMGKLRSAKDVEPLQPLLRKYIGFLETEISPTNTNTSRPRVQLERTTIWLGIKTLLGFLEAPAFEDGILEKYPNFLSSVLNLVSDDTLESSYALTCLKACFEMLGCKLWWRTTLSPSVMRNTLLGQCFHTRNEKSHKDIFDLFLPFLQSLEALQDGELEKQRRHFIYFLLHQVTQSSNFSTLTRKNARKIALLIIHRGYKMNPPCPPFECGHMWGPSLVNSLKDSSLHYSLRQPAFDLIETIVISDVSALISLTMKCRSLSNISSSMSGLNIDVDELFLFHCIEDDKNCWSEFTVQSKLASHECVEWTCLPMLWFDILVEMSPSMLPVSFSKAVFWALSHISMVLPNVGSELSLSIKDWLSLHAKEISLSFGWEAPNGSDDGGDGKESRNSVKVSSMCNILIQTFKRFAAGFVTEIEKNELHRQWIWEPRMAESLIILLIDPDDAIRQANKVILEHVSKARDLTPQLKFLCYSASSLSSLFSGLRFALKQVQSDYNLSSFQNLHHLFFVVHKLVNDVVKSPSPAIVINEADSSQFSSKGGFLRQPCFESSPPTLQCSEIAIDMVTWEKFSYFLSLVMWPFILKCLKEGNKFCDIKTHQMTFVRLLDAIPFIYERISLSRSKSTQLPIVSGIFDFKWLSDLVDLKKSSLPIIARRWKLCMLALMNLFKTSCSDTILCTISIIEAIVSQNAGVLDNLKDEILKLIKSMSDEVSCTNYEGITKPVSSYFEPFYIKEDGHSEDTTEMHKLKDTDVIVLSDDERPNASTPKLGSLSNKPDHEKGLISDERILSSGKSLVLDRPTESTNSNVPHDQLKPIPPEVLDEDSSSSSEDESHVTNNNFPTKIKSYAGKTTRTSRKQTNDLKPFPSGIFDEDSSSSEEETCHVANNKLAKSFVNRSSTSLVRPGIAGRDKRISSSIDGSGMARTLKDANSKFSSMKDNLTTQNFSSKVSKNTSTLQKNDALVMELVSDSADDPLEHALNNAKRPQFTLPKATFTAPKRKVIQLNMLTNNKYGDRLNTGIRRLKPPKLDDWYRPIFELDYFSVVGLSSAKREKCTPSVNLKEVPLCFKSAEHYVQIFRPLVLEEFKAQLLNSYLETSPDDTCCGSICILSVERIDDFHIVRGRPDNSEILFKGCVENDLILLTREPLKNSVQDVHILGKVEKRDKSNKNESAILVMRFYLLNSSSRSNNVIRFLTERSKWYITKIMSLTPQIREFQALSSLHEIPMLPIILDPTARLFGSKDRKNVELSRLTKPLQNILKSSFNASQLEAISLAIRSNARGSNFELNLVQGPPGTGKTRTIVAIVSALLSLNSVHESTNISRTNPRTHISNSAAIARAWQDAALAKQMMKETEKTSQQTVSTKGRVLICAQSNAAVDELVSRISEGLYGNDGKLYKPYLVRVGNAKTIHPNSQRFFIDTLVEQRLAEDKTNDDDSNNEEKLESSTSLRSKLEKLVDNIRYYESRRAKLDGGDVNATSNDDNVEKISDDMLGAKLNMLYSQKRALCGQISIAQSREKKASEESWAMKKKIRKSILMEAEIVVTTLSGCGGDLYTVCSESSSSSKFGRFSEQCLFDIVVIDEAAQALEPATLIPLQLLKSNGTKCIMVGDPKQLPATVLSNVASKFMYECSMFERLQRAGHPVVMLTEQYRMHPEICRFPSSHFYENKLSNGAQMTSKVAPFHENSCLGPYMFFDIIDGLEHRGKSSASLSIYNDSEVEAAVRILKFLKSRYPYEFAPGRIGIITPYRSQLSLLRSRFSNAFGSDIASDMEFNTVDGFQGREVDILILSTVRASDSTNSTSIGFVADVRRMNVALTRAKFSLWIIGSAQTLRSNPHWAALIENAKERNLLVSVSKPYDSIFGNAPPPQSKNPSSMKSRPNSTKTSFEVSKRRNNQTYPKESLNSQSHVPSSEVATMKRHPLPSIEGGGKKIQRHPSTGRTKMLHMPHENTAFRKPYTERNQRGNDNTMKRKIEGGSMLNDDEKSTKSKHLHDRRSPNVESSSDGLKIGRDWGRSSNHATSSGPNRRNVPSDEDPNELSKNNGSRANVGISPKSLLANRKRQREDVEALMPSAFIPSKKYQGTSRPRPGK